MIQVDTKLEVFRRMCLIRYFELEAKKAYEAGHIKPPIYLSVGQESIASALSVVCKDYYILAQHRAHSVYLAFGGNPEKLIDELLGLPTGCTKGLGGSPSIQSDEIKMIGHHGLIGENVPLAVGVALGSGDRTLCIFGDGAAEEDYILPSMGFAQTHGLPVLFVCEDNNLSILTEKSVRRNWEMSELARSMGMLSFDIEDDPQDILKCAEMCVKILPAFINIRTCRHLWHAGAGIDNKPAWDRFTLVAEQLVSHGGLEQSDCIQTETQEYVRKLWAERLQKL